MSPFGRASSLVALVAGLRLLIPQPGEVPSFGVLGGMQEAGRSLRGVYGFSLWSLIECLEDKLGDISHPSGQRMGG